MVDVYMINDAGAFQVDCDGGEFTFRPSRFGPGRVELIDYPPGRTTADGAWALILGALRCGGY